MPKMHLHGITITVTEKEIDFFKRVGYEIVEVPAPTAPESIKPVIAVEPDAPAEVAKPQGKKK
jgi:hypothetical protein